MPGVWGGGGGDDGTFPSGVRWPGRGEGDKWHGGSANLGVSAVWSDGVRGQGQV